MPLKRMPLAYSGPLASRIIMNRLRESAGVEAEWTPTATDNANMSGRGHFDLVLVDTTQSGIPRIHLAASIAASQHLPVLSRSETLNGVAQARTLDYAYLEEPANQAALVCEAQRVIREAEILTREIKSSVDKMESEMEVLQDEIVEAHRQFDLVMVRLGYQTRG